MAPGVELAMRRGTVFVKTPPAGSNLIVGGESLVAAGTLPGSSSQAVQRKITVIK
jgi:hypothetical protein